MVGRVFAAVAITKLADGLLLGIGVGVLWARVAMIQMPPASELP
jgi:hypothetical protein